MRFLGAKLAVNQLCNFSCQVVLTLFDAFAGSKALEANNLDGSASLLCNFSNVLFDGNLVFLNESLLQEAEADSTLQRRASTRKTSTISVMRRKAESTR